MSTNAHKWQPSPHCSLNTVNSTAAAKLVERKQWANFIPCKHLPDWNAVKYGSNAALSLMVNFSILNSFARLEPFPQAGSAWNLIVMIWTQCELIHHPSPSPALQAITHTNEQTDKPINKQTWTHYPLMMDNNSIVNCHVMIENSLKQVKWKL